MLDHETEIRDRVAFIRAQLSTSGCTGIVFGSSGGKDSVLVGILCKMACENTVGLVMPCGSKRNYGEDKEDAFAFAEQYKIETRTVDMTPARDALIGSLSGAAALTPMAEANINPRLRMAALYAVAASENRLVAGTGNRSEIYMGYFTKWGDGASDFDPIADLTVTEVYELLRFLGAPENIIEKAPSAALFEGQTDEAEMGISYAAIDKFLLTGEAAEADRAILRRFHSRSEHKRKPVPVFERGE